MRALLAALATALLAGCAPGTPSTPAPAATRAPSVVEASGWLVGEWVRDGGDVSTATIVNDGTWRETRAGAPDPGRLFYWSVFPGSHPPFSARITVKREALYVELKNANEPLQPPDFFELTSVSADGFAMRALGGSLFSAGERLAYGRATAKGT